MGFEKAHANTNYVFIIYTQVRMTIPIQRERREEEPRKKSEGDPQKTKHGPPTGSLVLMSFCGLTATAVYLDYTYYINILEDAYGC